MSITESIDRYFAAWNAHDGPALAALFAKSKRDAYVYEDPTSRIAVRAGDLESVVAWIGTVFPDFQFSITSRFIDAERAVVEWLLTGTNTAPLKAGVNATGRALHLPGIDVVEADSDGLTRVRRYFDQKSMFEQIGMQVIVEPHVQDQATFGYSKRVSSGNPHVPGALAVTWIGFREQSELDRIRTHAAQIIDDFLKTPGFIGIVTGATGNRAFTVTAWENEEALRQGLEQSHLRAKQEFRTTDLSWGVWTSVWKPHRLNRMWSKCTVCAQPNDVTADVRACANCGAALSERTPYW